MRSGYAPCNRYYTASDLRLTLSQQAAMPEFVLVFAVLSLALGGYWAMVIFPKQRAFQHKQKDRALLACG